MFDQHYNSNYDNGIKRSNSKWKIDIERGERWEGKEVRGGPGRPFIKLSTVALKALPN